MCYLPIHAAMVAFLFEVTGEVPKTETEIYTHFTRFTLKRSFSKRGRNSMDVHNLGREEETLFSQICKLALDKTVLNKQVLHQDEINFQHNIGQDISLGLITVDRTAHLYDFKDIYTFLHLTFQEYLAAYYISTLSHEKQLEQINKFGSEKHMLVVWKFYCGLVDFTDQNHKFDAILDKTAGLLFHTQCAYESQQSLPCTSVLNSTNFRFAFRDKNLTMLDFKAIAYILSKSLLPTKLLLVNCIVKYNIEAMNDLLIQSSSNLTELDLSGNALGEDGAIILAHGLTSCQLERINIRKNAISIDGVLTIFSCIRRYISKLSSDDVTIGNDITYEQFSCFILKQCTNLQSLEIILDLATIESLNSSLYENRTSLQELKVYLLQVGDIEATTTLSRHICTDLQLHTILLNNFDMCGRSAESLSEALSRCPNLQLLDLSNSRNLGTAGIEAIAASLNNCTSLAELHLNNCMMISEGAKALFLYLKNYPNLRYLSLHSNEIDEVGTIKKLAGSIHCTMDIRYNIDKEGVVHI